MTWLKIQIFIPLSLVEIYKSAILVVNFFCDFQIFSHIHSDFVSDQRGRSGQNSLFGLNIK